MWENSKLIVLLYFSVKIRWGCKMRNAADSKFYIFLRSECRIVLLHVKAQRHLLLQSPVGSVTDEQTPFCTKYIMIVFIRNFGVEEYSRSTDSEVSHCCFSGTRRHYCNSIKILPGSASSAFCPHCTHREPLLSPFFCIVGKLRKWMSRVASSLETPHRNVRRTYI